MGKPRNSIVLVQFRITPAEYRMLVQGAKRNGVSMNALVRYLLSQYAESVKLPPTPPASIVAPS